MAYAVRTLARSPGFTLVALASLALGIGANTSIFTLVNAILLRPLPVHEPDRLFDVYTLDGSNAGRNLIPVSIPNYDDLRGSAEAFEGLVAVFSGGFTLDPGDGGDPRGVPGAVVGGGYFETLGVEPALGRLLHPSDDGARGTGAVAVLSYATWTTRFGADPAVLGRTIRLNDVPVEVVGVAPAGFRGRRTLSDAERVWLPFSMLYEVTPPGLHFFFDARRALPIDVFGRLAPGVDPETARAELAALSRRLEADHPDANRDRSFEMVSTAAAAVGVNQRENLNRSGAAGMVVVGLILLIACANLANLLLFRAAGRTRELALRAALGARRSALIRQTLVESLLLAVAGGALGLALAGWGSRLLLALGADLLPPGGAVDPSLDGRVLAFTAVLALGTGLLFGAVPAIRAGRTDLNGILKEGGRQGAGLARSPLRSVLVVAEVALAVVGLAGAGLLLRSMHAATVAPLGYTIDGLGVVGVPLGQGLSPDEGLDLLRRARDEALAVPGVEAAGFGGVAPLTQVPVRTFLPEGAPAERASSFVNVVPAMPGYLATLGLRAAVGRGLDDDDLTPGARAVAVVNETLAERYWPGEDPVGRRFSFYADSVVREVVGVVPTVAFSRAGEEPQPAAYLPWSQWPQGFAVLHVRSGGDGVGPLAAAAERIRALDPDRAVQPPRTARDLQWDTLRARRIGAGLVGAFAAVALVLAVVGIHAVLSTVSRQRTHEIGVRMALGARPDEVLWMVVRQGMTLVVVGVGLGLVGAVVAGRFVRGLLFGVDPVDPVTLAVVPLLLVAVAFLACLGPALRSTRTNPAEALTP